MTTGGYKVQRYRVKLVRDGVQRLALGRAQCEWEAAAVLKRLLIDVPHEELWLLLLDAKLSLLGAVKVAQGGLDACAAKPADVLRPVIISGASAFVLGHNHPSGDPTPSRADIEMTGHIAEASAILGVTLADHLVIARSGHRSLRDVFSW